MNAGEVVSPLTEVLASLVNIDLETLDDVAVRESLLSLLRCRNQLDAVIAGFVGVFDDRRLSVRDACRTTKQWLEAFGHLSGPAATGRMRAVEITRLLPALAGAFETGDVSAEHVNRIGLTAEEVGDEVIEQAEQILLPLARGYDPDVLGEGCAHLRDRALADKQTPPEEQYRRRGVTLTRLGDMWKLRGILDTETGMLFTTALDAFAKAPVAGDDRSPTQRRHDALADMLGAILRDGRAPDVAGVRPHVGLIMPVQRYLHLHDHTGGAASNGGGAAGGGFAGGGAARSATDGGAAGEGGTDGGVAGEGVVDGAAGDDDGPALLERWGPIPNALASRLTCDATLQQLWLHPDNGVPLQLGRAYRNTPPALRRALAVRDPVCRWPGCKIPASWCDSHHLREWMRDHGTTDVDNLVNLCRYHHVCVHERGWGLHRDPANGWISITRPDGTPYELGPSRPRTDGLRYDGLRDDHPPPD